MIGNVVDKRTNKYKVDVFAIIEPSWHDNTCEGATQFENKHPTASSYESMTCTVADAMKFAYERVDYVTVFLYDAEDSEL